MVVQKDLEADLGKFVFFTRAVRSVESFYRDASSAFCGWFKGMDRGSGPASFHVV